MKLKVILLVLVLVFINNGYLLGFDFNSLNLNMGQTAVREDVTTGSIPGEYAKSGIKLSLPGGWKIIRDEPNSIDAQGPRGMFLAIVMNDYGDDFPVKASITAYKKSAIKEKQHGKLIDWSERVIDKVTGVQRIEAPMSNPTDPRRITWIGYKGSLGINIVASSESMNFDSCFPMLNQVMDSIRW